MKFLVASDIHGSAYYAKELIESFKREKADKIILLGDIYNHGPRNSLPKEYDPIRVSSVLNEQVKDLIVIKGNCDSEVDEMISDFTFSDNLCIFINGKTVFLTHGHVYNKDKMPKTKFDVMIYGHFHVGFIEKSNGVIIANTGSVSIPKNESKNSYIIIDENGIELKEITGKVIEKCLF